MKMPTKQQVLDASESCPDAKETLKKLFPEAFKEEWVDVSTEIDWRFRADANEFGVLTMRHKGNFIGHFWINGEFYWTDDDYKREVSSSNFRILKRRSK